MDTISAGQEIKMAKEKTTSDDGASNKKFRLNINLSQKNNDRINHIVEMMGAETITEATKDAFRLLEYFLKVSRDGGKFYIQMPGEDIKQIEVFGITTEKDRL